MTCLNEVIHIHLIVTQLVILRSFMSRLDVFRCGFGGTTRSGESPDVNVIYHKYKVGKYKRNRLKNIRSTTGL